jgi:Domain of unknown function (DUF5666)
MAQALLDSVRLPEPEIPVKALLWSTVAAVTVCGCDGREVLAISPAPSLASATAPTAMVSTNAGKPDAEVAGALVAVKGSCPVMTFTVAGTMIWMDSTTVLNGLSCAQIANGTVVRVSGFRRQDGSILASAISASQR